MHTEHLDRLAVRRPFRLAARAFFAGKVRVNDDLLADGKRHALSNHEHRARQLVTWHARICQTRYTSLDQAKVGSADPDMADSHQRPAFARRTRRRMVSEPQFARCDTAYGFHVESHVGIVLGHAS